MQVLRPCNPTRVHNVVSLLTPKVWMPHRLGRPQADAVKSFACLRRRGLQRSSTSGNRVHASGAPSARGDVESGGARGASALRASSDQAYRRVGGTPARRQGPVAEQTDVRPPPWRQTPPLPSRRPASDQGIKPQPLRKEPSPPLPPPDRRPRSDQPTHKPAWRHPPTVGAPSTVRAERAPSRLPMRAAAPNDRAGRRPGSTLSRRSAFTAASERRPLTAKQGWAARPTTRVETPLPRPVVSATNGVHAAPVPAA
eukprot:352607-Chlamydomonas_euryale.AAC.2